MTEICKAYVVRAGVLPQTKTSDGRPAERPHMVSQGVWFSVPKDAEGITLEPDDNPSAGVLVNAQGAVPDVELLPGEGGLHFLGTFKVFLNAAGQVCLGSYDPDDFVALASKVDAGFSSLRADITTLKSAIAAGLTAVGVGAAANGGTGATAFNTAAAPLPSAIAGVGSTEVRAQ